MKNNSIKETLNKITQYYKHLNKDRLCYYSNKLYPKDEIVKLTIKDRGYGSIFDGCNFTIQLHQTILNELYKEDKLKPQWFCNESMFTLNDGYEHELEISNFVDNLILENQEYIKNSENDKIGIKRNLWILLSKEGKCIYDLYY